MNAYQIDIVTSASACRDRMLDWHSWYGILQSGWPRGTFHGNERAESDASLLFRIENGRVIARATSMPKFALAHAMIDCFSVSPFCPQPARRVRIEVVLATYVRGGSGKAHALYDPKAKHYFLTDRLKVSGFQGSVEDISFSPTFWFRSASISRPVANYSATLQIDDWDSFRRLLTSGVGRDRSSGCGLVVVR